MLSVRRRAILAALIGAFAQTAVAQKKERQSKQPADSMLDWIKLQEIPQTTALSLVIAKSDKVTAISVVVDGQEEKISPKELLEALRPHKPVNNECPVCGTMAPPYHDPGPCLIADMTCLTHGPSRIGMENLIRCKNCNAAFWQVSE